MSYHYIANISETIVAPIYDQVGNIYKNAVEIPHLQMSSSFYDHEGYLQLLADQIKQQLAEKTFDMILFSYHGIPVSIVEQGDPYEEQCKLTTQKVMEKVGDFLMHILINQNLDQDSG